MKKGKDLGMISLIIGLALILLMMNISLSVELTARTATPNYDGSNSHFDLEITDYSTIAEVDDLYTANVKVTNTDSTTESMYVQCSIFDREEQDWIPTNIIQSFAYLETKDNCVDNEPYTQTARVTLSGGATQTIPFTMKVPNNLGSNNIVWCGTYEKCYSEESPEIYESDAEARSIQIVEDDNDEENNEYVETSDDCTRDDDCKFLGFIGGDECVNGRCIDQENNPETNNDDWKITLPDDNKIINWLKQNKIMAWGIAITIFVIGFMLVFKEPKRRY